MSANAAFVACLAFIALLASPAHGGGHDPGAADTLFQQAQRLADAGDFPAACPKFAESLRLEPAAGTLLNLANCEEHIGRWSAAIGHYGSALEMLPERDARVPIARQRLAELKRRVPRLLLRATRPLPADATLERDGVALGPASLGVELPIDPGEHELVLRAPGRAERRWKFRVREREAKTIELEPGAPPERAAPAQPDAPSSGASQGDSHGGRRTAGWILAGVGVAGLGAALLTGLMVQDRKKTMDANCNDAMQCNQRGLDAAHSGQSLLAWNTAAWGVGLVGLGVGTYLILTTRVAPNARAGIRPSPGGAQLVWQGAW